MITSFYHGAVARYMLAQWEEYKTSTIITFDYSLVKFSKLLNHINLRQMHLYYKENIAKSKLKTHVVCLNPLFLF